MPPAVVKKSSAVVAPEMPKWNQRLAAFLIHIFIQAITLTLRKRYVDRAGLRESKLRHAAIYCVWHNRLAMSMPAYFGYIRRHNQSSGLAAMASASRDGGMLIAVIERFGVQAVRGSTSRRGPQALRELTTWARRGYDLAITPDGPRGPRYQLQEGIVALAQLTGMPIVAVTINLGWKISVKSWDRFQIPLPFSRCEFVYEQPVHVPRETSEAGRESFRVQLEKALRDISVD